MVELPLPYPNLFSIFVFLHVSLFTIGEIIFLENYFISDIFSRHHHEIYIYFDLNIKGV